MDGDPAQSGRIGHYFGTEIDEKWWKRYTKDKMLARGKGRYWLDDGRFYFLRFLTRTPIAIPLGAILDVKIGTWHAGQWGGGKPVLKIVWIERGQRLSSGFTLSTDGVGLESFIAELSAARGAPPGMREA